MTTGKERERLNATMKPMGTEKPANSPHPLSNEACPPVPSLLPLPVRQDSPSDVGPPRLPPTTTRSSLHGLPRVPCVLLPGLASRFLQDRHPQCRGLVAHVQRANGAYARFNPGNCDLQCLEVINDEDLRAPVDRDFAFHHGFVCGRLVVHRNMRVAWCTSQLNSVSDRHLPSSSPSSLLVMPQER